MLEEISPESEVHTHRAALEKLALEFSTLLLCQSEVKDDLVSSARRFECGVTAALFVCLDHQNFMICISLVVTCVIHL